MEGEQFLCFVGLSGDVFENPWPLEGVVECEVGCRFDGPSDHWFDALISQQQARSVSQKFVRMLFGCILMK